MRWYLEKIILTASDYAHEIEHGISDTLYRVDLDDKRNPTKTLLQMSMPAVFCMKKEKPNTTVFSLICGTIPKKPNTDRIRQQSRR